MKGNSLAAKHLALDDAKASYNDYVAEAALAQLHTSPEYRAAESKMARDEAALKAMETSVAEARMLHLEREMGLVRAHLGLSPEYRKANHELERNDELVAVELALIAARETHQRLEEELVRAQLRVSPALLEAEEAMARTQATLLTKIVEDAHGWVLRAEDELTETEKRLEAAIGKVVLEGPALARDVELVKAALFHANAVLENRRKLSEDHVFARWCLDVAKHQRTGELKVARPEDKERLEAILASLDLEYAFVTKKTPLPDDQYQELVSEILARPENIVNEEWFIAQSDALEALEPTVSKTPVASVEYSLVR